ncbi:hypothetical protein [Streptomyces sp. MBT55]|uniref:DUF6907 domain-containing protein n=1 Tax=Streptomyces sp. MBT55 TaxID=1488386 RepID=UPI00191482B9|nr:hypothetical protein [Streptomyces sp. MBT55]MBK6040795.1 hypothetical protein [Streptomyces sp. MBT55]
MRNTTSIPATFKPSGGIVTQPTAEATAAPSDVLKRLTLGDVPTVPVDQLLTGLGVTVIEVEPGELSSEGISGYFRGRVGAAEIHVERTLPQTDREPVIRQLLAKISPVEETHVVRVVEEPPPAAPTATEDLWAVWQSMTLGETAKMPLDQLLTLLGVHLEEVDPGDLIRGIAARFAGRIGDATIEVSRTLPQADREPIVRSFLTAIGPDLTYKSERYPNGPVLREIPVRIECDEWCTESHDEAVWVDDIQHTSDEAHLRQPGGTDSPILFAHISSEPFSPDAAKRIPHLVVTDETEYFYPSPAESLEFADNLIEFGNSVRAMVHRAARRPEDSPSPAAPVAEPGHYPWCDTGACKTHRYDESDGGGTFVEHIGPYYDMPIPEGMTVAHNQLLSFNLAADESAVDASALLSFNSNGEGTTLDPAEVDQAIANLEAALSALRAMRAQMVQEKQA